MTNNSNIDTLNRIHAVISATEETKSITCPDCEGDGTTVGYTKVGGIDNGGSPWQGYEPYIATCESCDGSGYVVIDIIE